MKKITLLLIILTSAMTYSQVGINTDTPDASSALEIKSTSAGILIPRMTEAQREAITSPALSLMIYQTNNDSGFYFFDGSAWKKIEGVAGPQGDQGPNGADGQDGDSAYQIWLDAGNSGTEADFLLSIKGDPGTNGTDGVGVSSIVDNGDGTITYNFTDLSYSIITNSVADGVITSAKLLDNSVVSSKISDAAISESKLADDSISSSKIQDASITSAKIADGAVSSNIIADGSITGVKLDKANIVLSGFGAAADNIDMGANQLKNLGNPTDAQDAVTKYYLENQGYISQVPSETRSIIITPGMIDIENFGYGAGTNLFKVKFGGWAKPAIRFSDNDLNQIYLNSPLPADWDGGQLVLKVLYSTADTGGNVVFSISGGGVKIGENVEDPTSGNVYVATGSATTNSLVEYSRNLSSNSADKMIQIIFSRRGADVRDTSSDYLYLFGFTIEYTTN